MKGTIQTATTRMRIDITYYAEYTPHVPPSYSVMSIIILYNINVLNSYLAMWSPHHIRLHLIFYFPLFSEIVVFYVQHQIWHILCIGSGRTIDDLCCYLWAKVEYYVKIEFIRVFEGISRCLWVPMNDSVSVHFFYFFLLFWGSTNTRRRIWSRRGMSDGVNILL